MIHVYGFDEINISLLDPRVAWWSETEIGVYEKAE